jgi:hypothetical protein
MNQRREEHVTVELQVIDDDEGKIESNGVNELALKQPYEKKDIPRTSLKVGMLSAIGKDFGERR